MERGGYIYILTNKRNTVLYVGVNSRLEDRISDHKRGTVPGFTAKYRVNKFVYFEGFDRIEEAIAREKHLKGKTRAKKIALIAISNPGWRDLSL